MASRLSKQSKKRFTSMVQVKPLHTNWEVKMKLKADREAVQLHEKQIKDAKIEVLVEKKRRRDENKKRREENTRKAEIVQEVKNIGKLKRKSKKELRKLRKVADK